MSRDGKIVVYAAGVWDMFHVGHLNILKAAKALGDVLIVGVSTDELVFKYKGHHPLLSYEDRSAVVAACRYVDVVVPQRDIEKDEQLQKLDADILVVGDDWWNFVLKFTKLKFLVPIAGSFVIGLRGNQVSAGE